MKKITVRFKPSNQKVTVEPGTSILSAARNAGIRLESDCGGMGRCGKCKVVVRSGVTPLGPKERDFLTPREIKENVRLACQALATSATTVFSETPPPGKEHILETGITRTVSLRPAMEKRYLDIGPDELKENRPIAEIIEHRLRRIGITKPSIGFSSLKALSPILHESPNGITVISKGTEVLGFEAGDTRTRNYGLAIDIGTTTVVGYLYDMDTGSLRGVYSRLNGQSPYGSDVVTRIEHAIKTEGGLIQLQESICDTVNRITENLCHINTISSSDIYTIVIVGNTPMIHLFWGLPPRFLSRFPYNPLTTRPLCAGPEDVGIDMNRLGRIISLPLISGFIGSDTVGAVLSTGLHKSRTPKLLIDIGTNGEVVLTNGLAMAACSCAAGPAFEGAHIACGMRGAGGAIDRVDFADNDIHYDVIDDVPPKGICGSGLVDAVAEMLKAGLITPDGRLVTEKETPNPFYAGRLTYKKYGRFSITGRDHLPGGAQEVLITQKDIRELQLAKGAIMAGIKILIDRLGLQEQDIREVYLAGAFGNYIRPDNAVAIGLLPVLKNARVTQVGNAAGSGAKMALLSQKAFKQAIKIAGRIEYVELAKIPEFQEDFFEGMAFPI
jgi:uncharacterized 2Fe-2S/4Fe-4S cluster protein (DUF4445 family)